MNKKEIDLEKIEEKVIDKIVNLTDAINKNSNDTESKKSEVKKEPVDKMILFVCIGFAILCISVLTIGIVLNYKINADNKEPSDNKEIIDNKDKYLVKLHIDFTENILFSRYDVKLSFGKNEELLKHGVNKDFSYYLDKGNYELSFVDSDDSTIHNEEKIEVNSNMEIGYKISCYNNRIDVENLYFDRDVELASNEIKIDFDNSKFKYEDYKEVINELKDLGFTNIVEKPLYDIILGITKEGEVKNVTINGTDNYKRGNIFNKDTEIIVTYHLKQEDDPSRISPPYDADTIDGMYYKDAEQAFKDAGFKNVKVDSYITTNYSENEKAFSVKINLEDAKKSEKYNPNDEVKICYYTYKKSESSSKPRPEETELSHYGAQKAFENYGKMIYRYGFKCHWFMNLIDAEDRSDGSIYYKVGVTITNQYNASYEAVAEGIVSGTDANPIISGFNVK